MRLPKPVAALVLAAVCSVAACSTGGDDTTTQASPTPVVTTEAAQTPRVTTPPPTPISVDALAKNSRYCGQVDPFCVEGLRLEFAISHKPDRLTKSDHRLPSTSYYFGEDMSVLSYKPATNDGKAALADDSSSKNVTFRPVDNSGLTLEAVIMPSRLTEGEVWIQRKIFNRLDRKVYHVTVQAKTRQQARKILELLRFCSSLDCQQ